MRTASLAEYRRKRDFHRTAEPPAVLRARGPRQRRFVVQEHAASRLHFDLRLEVDGVLKSWAVPKGIPLRNGERRLAIQVEDHPVSYLNFEGVIPKGQYGGGTVTVWDTGTFEPVKPWRGAGLPKNSFHFRLHGAKLEGEWLLVRFGDDVAQWLLIRHGPASQPVCVEPEAPEKSSRPKAATAPGTLRGAPPFIAPMMAKLVEKAPPGKWLYELKFDGYRALALKGGGEVKLVSRNRLDLSAKFPELRDAVAALGTRDAVLDGEIVALGPDGRPSFQLLQAFAAGEQQPPLYFYAFDLLRHGGVDFCRRPLLDRKEALRQLLDGAPAALRYSAPLGGDAGRLLALVSSLGLEGLVGKRPDSLYEAGSRSGSWIKLKLVQDADLVIGGYTLPEGGRAHLGALILGHWRDGRLRFAGKVGSGFSGTVLRQLIEKLRGLSISTCPFGDLPEDRRSRWGQALTVAEMKRCHWVRPELVCRVRFREWTRDGKLRQPVFEELRAVKSSQDVEL